MSSFVLNENPSILELAIYVLPSRMLKEIFADINLKIEEIEGSQNWKEAVWFLLKKTSGQSFSR